MFNLIDLKTKKKYLSKEEEQVCFLQDINENLQYNVILYNVLSDISFHTIHGNMSDYNVDVSIVIYADNLFKSKKIAEKIAKMRSPFHIVSLLDKHNEKFTIENNNIYFVSMPLVINSSQISVNNEDESVKLSLHCKPFIQQTITKIEMYFGLTSDGRKWLKLFESLLK